MSKFETLKKVLASGKAEAHCYPSWMNVLKQLETAQNVANEAMQMSSSEDLPIEMKAQLAGFAANLYSVQQELTELLEELREVDAGAPAKQADEEAQEKEENE